MYLFIQKLDSEGFLLIFSIVRHYQVFTIQYRGSVLSGIAKMWTSSRYLSLYHDATELKDNAKLLGPVASRTNLRRLNIKVGRIEGSTRDKSGQNFLLDEALAHLSTYPTTR